MYSRTIYLDHAAQLADNVVQPEQVDGQFTDGWYGDYWSSLFFHEHEESLEHRSSVWLVTHFCQLVQNVIVDCLLYTPS